MRTENTTPWDIGSIPCRDLPTAISKIWKHVLTRRKNGLDMMLRFVLACYQSGREKIAIGSYTASATAAKIT